jgi:hypothetical protein
MSNIIFGIISNIIYKKMITILTEIIKNDNPSFIMINEFLIYNLSHQFLDISLQTSKHAEKADTD